MLHNDRQLANTRKMLADMERVYAQSQADPCDHEGVKEMELGSLKKFINQLKEEIARYEARRTVRG